MHRTQAQPNTSDSMDYEFVTQRSSKVSKPETKQEYDLINKKIEQHFIIWNEKLESTIQGTVTRTIESTTSVELAKISAALTNINSNILKLNDDYNQLSRTLSETNSKLNTIEHSLNFISSRQDSLEDRVFAIESKNVQVTELTGQVYCLEKKISTLEQQARQCNAEISNLPEKKSENLLNIFESLSRLVDYSIKKSDIISIHRVPHADVKSTRPKNIIVKFTSRIMRDNFLSAYRGKKGLTSETLGVSGPAHKIYCNEHLTLENKTLFRKCREAASQKNIKYVWVKHGTILTRKSDTSPVIAIKSPQDFGKL